jgi:hypothetical protein
MSHSNWRSDASFRYGIGHILAGWAVALVLALIISSDLIAYVVASRDLEGREIECRRQQIQEYAQRQTATGKKQPPAPPNSSRDSEKIARDYCIQRRSAEVADDQAKISRWTGLIGFLAFAIAIVGTVAAGIAAKGTWDTARHAAEAASATEHALLVSRRPWLSVEPRLGIGGLQFHRGRELRLLLDLELWNNGRSPADDIQVFAKFCPLSADAKAALVNLRAAAKSGNASAIPLLYKPIFPQNMDIYPLPIYLRSEDIAAALPRLNGRWTDPAVVGCVLYKSPFAPAVVHDTCFIVELSDGRDPSAGRPFEVSDEGFLIAGEIPAGELRLHQVYFSGALS